MSWKDIVCSICLSPYRNCGHWPGYPQKRPSPEELEKIYHQWKHPVTAEKPKPARVARVVEPRVPRPPRPVNPLNLAPSVHAWLSALGQRGGASRSERKVAASRANGKLHGGMMSKII
jgi:acyl-CoA thioesterase